ncbi:MAG TPA: GvpL/GvpF family gas vesicle protein [Streptosporangiaceae bacterium]|nr:GvpL/GvpF family gas vesicle protein [Streptosporangiaceae bacterium]
MTAQARTRSGPGPATACYIYGIVPAGVRAPRGESPVGDGGHRVATIRHGTIAALTSPVDLSVPIGTPDDLVAHQRILDAVASRAPVLPMRFGAVLAEPDAVKRELLADHHDEFAAGLDQLSGTVQYVVAGRYDQDVVLTEILTENDQAGALAAAIRGEDELATRDLRIQLGELINAAIASKRDADTVAFARTVEPLCAAIAVRGPSHEEDAVHLALLVDRASTDELGQLVDQTAAAWGDRVHIRLLGPMAPYDFATTAPAVQAPGAARLRGVMAHAHHIAQAAFPASSGGSQASRDHR